MADHGAISSDPDRACGGVPHPGVPGNGITGEDESASSAAISPAAGPVPAAAYLSLALLPGAAAAKQDRHFVNGKGNVVSVARTPHHSAGRAGRPYRVPLTLACGVGDEFGDFLGLALVEDARRHPARRRRAVDAVFDRVEDATFGLRLGFFDFLLAAFRRARGGEEFVEVRRVVAVGPGGVQRVAGAAIGLEERLPFLQARGDVLRPRGRVPLGAEDGEGDCDCEEDDDDPEPDEGALAHSAARILDDLLPPASARFFRYQGHIRRSSHSPQRGFGRQTARPWRIRLTCSSCASSAGTIASISSWARSKEALAGKSPRRPPTRWTWTSTGISGMPQVKISTQAAVLRPTPGRPRRNSSDSARGASSVQSRSGGLPCPPRGALIPRALCFSP